MFYLPIIALVMFVCLFEVFIRYGVPDEDLRGYVRKVHVHLGIVIARYPAAIIAVLFYSTADRLGLRGWAWLMTKDNPLTGDGGHQARMRALGLDPLSIPARILWLFRNGGNTYNYLTLGCMDNATWRLAEPQTPGLHVRHDGFWLYRRFWRLPFGRSLEIFKGWALFGPQAGWCKIVLTVRFPRTQQ